MAHDYDRAAAEKIVEEQGTASILADRAAELEAKENAAAKVGRVIGSAAHTSRIRA
jgi:hypothetical protein